MTYAESTFRETTAQGHTSLYLVESARAVASASASLTFTGNTADIAHMSITTYLTASHQGPV